MPTVTIHVAGPGYPINENGRAGKSRAGHMWYVLNEGSSDQSSFGFGPAKGGSFSAVGGLKRNDPEVYGEGEFSLTLEISDQQYQALVNFAENWQFNCYMLYNAVVNNCVRFVWDALSFAGLNPAGIRGSPLPMNNIAQIKALGALNNIPTIREAEAEASAGIAAPMKTKVTQLVDDLHLRAPQSQALSETTLSERTIGQLAQMLAGFKQAEPALAFNRDQMSGISNQNLDGLAALYLSYGNILF